MCNFASSNKGTAVQSLVFVSLLTGRQPISGTEIMTHTFAQHSSEEVTKFKEYRLMYFFGCWYTKDVIPADDDETAIMLSDYCFGESKLQNWKHVVALFDGNRLVKQYR